MFCVVLLLCCCRVVVVLWIHFTTQQKPIELVLLIYNYVSIIKLFGCLCSFSIIYVCIRSVYIGSVVGIVTRMFDVCL
jgi:hypothetical protein